MFDKPTKCNNKSKNIKYDRKYSAICDMISKLKDKKQRHNYTDIAKNDSRICNKGERRNYEI